MGELADWEILYIPGKQSVNSWFSFLSAFLFFLFIFCQSFVLYAPHVSVSNSMCVFVFVILSLWYLETFTSRFMEV